MNSVEWMFVAIFIEHIILFGIGIPLSLRYFIIKLRQIPLIAAMLPAPEPIKWRFWKK
jgi:hypothetical protein